MIRCLDIGVEQEHPFLVLEPIGGNQLGATRLKGGARQNELAKWMITICEAVHSLHEWLDTRRPFTRQYCDQRQ